MLKRLSRIRCNNVRIPLLLLWYPFQMSHFAACMLWNAPHRFLKLEAWDTAHWFYWQGLIGAFVDL